VPLVAHGTTREGQEHTIKLQQKQVISETKSMANMRRKAKTFISTKHLLHNKHWKLSRH